MITHQLSTMNTSREPRLKSPYPPTTHHILQYHWTPSNKTNPRPHRHNQVKNHQPWLNPPIHHNSHTTLTNKPESLPNQPLIETKDNQLKTITIAHHEITYRITHNITNKSHHNTITIHHPMRTNSQSHQNNHDLPNQAQFTIDRLSTNESHHQNTRIKKNNKQTTTRPQFTN